MIDPWQNLANAIIRQAADDIVMYRHRFDRDASKSLVAQKERHYRTAKRFFESDWYEQLTDVDAEYLWERLKEL